MPITYDDDPRENYRLRLIEPGRKKRVTWNILVVFIIIAVVIFSFPVMYLIDPGLLGKVTVYILSLPLFIILIFFTVLILASRPSEARKEKARKFLQPHRDKIEEWEKNVRDHEKIPTYSEVNRTDGEEIEYDELLEQWGHGSSHDPSRK